MKSLSIHSIRDPKEDSWQVFQAILLRLSARFHISPNLPEVFDRRLEMDLRLQDGFEALGSAGSQGLRVYYGV